MSNEYRTTEIRIREALEILHREPERSVRAVGREKAEETARQAVKRAEAAARAPWLATARAAIAASKTRRSATNKRRTLYKNAVKHAVQVANLSLIHI